jgi:hypothetical protein
MPTRTEDIAAFAAWFDDIPRIHAAFDQYARTVAEHAHPNCRAARAAADRAIQNRDDAWAGLPRRRAGVPAGTRSICAH